MKIFRTSTLLVITILLVASAAGAELLVDTGPGPTESTGLFVSPTQFLAGQFTLADPKTITDLQGWIYTTTSGSADFVIYADTGTVPDTGTELLRAAAILPLSPPSTPDWHGVSGLSTTLAAGTYWVAIESTTSTSTMPAPAPSPLANYAFAQTVVYVNIGADLGFRVFGATPLPAAKPWSLIFTLSVLALAGAFSVARVLRTRRTAS